ncbi:inner membrane protein CreD [Klebsiella pneumoniae]|uniref:Inner membrane protein CreD n=1 Tax=Klebsiella pneumoniae TaxID=573 RepID=A0A377ZLT0_KLEPN|nr:inner membrane protein CreD [Klebsiella pneumoniae]
MLKSPLFWKITTLIGCIVLLSLPLMMVRELINERADYRSEVVDAIEQSTSGSQKLAGPLIAIPITETLSRMENQKEVNYQRSWVYYWLPESPGGHRQTDRGVEEGGHLQRPGLA